MALLAATHGSIPEAEGAVTAALEPGPCFRARGGCARIISEGWLLIVARNSQRDLWKSAATGIELTADDPNLLSPLDEIDPDAIGDRRLELVFACAHPGIDPAVRTPLMLQTCGGSRRLRSLPPTPSHPPASRNGWGGRNAASATRAFRSRSRTGRRCGRALVPCSRRCTADMPLPGTTQMAHSHHEPDSMAGEALHLAVTLAALLDTEAVAWSVAALIALALSRSGADGFVHAA